MLALRCVARLSALCAIRKGKLRRSDVDAERRALADRALFAIDDHVHLARRRPGGAHLDRRSGRQPLVVEPVEELAVVLGEADDLRLAACLELSERDELGVLCLLHLRLDRPAVRAAVGLAEALVDALDHLVGEGVSEFVGVHVRLGGRVAHEVREEALDDAVLADDALRPRGAFRSQDRFLLLPALDEPLCLEALQHLSRRRPGHAEHLGDTRCDRRRAGGRPVLADREGEEVDRLEVVVDRVALCAHPSLPLTASSRSHYSSADFL